MSQSGFMPGNYGPPNRFPDMYHQQNYYPQNGMQGQYGRGPPPKPSDALIPLLENQRVRVRIDLDGDVWVVGVIVAVFKFFKQFSKSVEYTVQYDWRGISYTNKFGPEDVCSYPSRG